MVFSKSKSIPISAKKCSFKEATDVVDCFFSTTTKETTLLVVGPSGVGKSTLVQDCARRSKINFTVLSPEELSDNHIGTVESNIISAFNPATFERDTHNETRSHIIFIDDIDVWAPCRVTSPVQTRVIALLNDFINDLVNAGMHNQHSEGVRFIATASSIHNVNPALIRRACINRIISLSALSHAERISWCSDALKSLYPQSHQHHQDLESLSQRFASMTPGYVHADMLRLFSSISRHCRDPDFPETPEQLLHSSLLTRISRSFAPSLLSQINPLLTSISSVLSHSKQLYGMDTQLLHLKQCLNAVFMTQSGNSMSEGAANIARALKSIRTLTGILIHGPTGCGKSALIHQVTKALPNKAVNVLPLDSASIVSSVIGQAERNLSNIFSVARMIAPTVIIIDNIDVMAPRREDEFGDFSTSSSNESFNRILSTLLVQIDGIRTGSAIDNPPVLIIATTRSSTLVDPALLRPGRIDVHIPVHMPDKSVRSEIINSILGKVAAHSLPLENIDRDSLVSQSEGWTTADVIAFVSDTISRSIRS